ncbi:hypothetical protein [Merismopedia glauca]|uniref:hypothetical protein n=1 Tax=Merismopedia glauca TaxID=292586 RepID=UPI0030DC4B1E
MKYFPFCAKEAIACHCQDCRNLTELSLKRKIFYDLSSYSCEIVRKQDVYISIRGNFADPD